MKQDNDTNLKLKKLMLFAQHWIGCCRSATPWLERQVLLFPIVVVILACTTFLFGGHCAAWQWWTSVSIILILPWLKVRYKIALVSDVMFLCILFMLYLISPMIVDAGGLLTDYQRYHLPMVRLFVEGWNPIQDPLASNIVEYLDLDIHGMSYLHVAFISKTMAIFSACAYCFVHDPFAMMFPLEILMLVSVFFAIRHIWHSSYSICALLMVVLLSRTIRWNWSVDATIALTSTGLLLTMYRSIREKRVCCLALFAFTFWMINLKLSTLPTTFVFWCLFVINFIAIVSINWKKSIQTFILLGLLLSFTFTIVSFNPYGTSFRDYGHPLYPFMTADETKFPQQNLAGDFNIANEDVDKMGYLGEFANAYISPQLVKAYYNWKLGRTDFHPHRYVWDISLSEIHKTSSPLNTKTRFTIIVGLFLLFILPKTRLLGFMMICSLFLLPKECFGYLRYQPWLEIFPLLAIVSLCEWFVMRFPKCRIFVVATVGILFLLTSVNWIRKATGYIITKEATIELNSNVIYPAYAIKSPLIDAVGDPRLEGKPLYLDCKPHLNASILQMRLANRHNVQVINLPDGETDGFWLTILGYYLPDSEKLPEPPKNLLKRYFQAWCITYPKVLARNLSFFK